MQVNKTLTEKELIFMEQYFLDGKCKTFKELLSIHVDFQDLRTKIGLLTRKKAIQVIRSLKHTTAISIISSVTKIPIRNLSNWATVEDTSNWRNILSRLLMAMTKEHLIELLNTEVESDTTKRISKKRRLLLKLPSTTTKDWNNSDADGWRRNIQKIINGMSLEDIEKYISLSDNNNENKDENEIHPNLYCLTKANLKIIKERLKNNIE